MASERSAELLTKAESADNTPLADGLEIPREIKHRQDRLATLQQAKAALETPAKVRFGQESAAHSEKLAARDPP